MLIKTNEFDKEISTYLSPHLSVLKHLTEKCNIAIFDDVGEKEGVDFLASLKVAEKAIEEKRKSLSGPFDKTAKHINQQFKEVLDTIKRLRADIETNVTAYRDSKEGGSIAGDVGTAANRFVWRWEVVNKEAIPMKYLVPDEAKIQLMVEAEMEIPGIKAWQERKLTVRTKKNG